MNRLDRSAGDLAPPANPGSRHRRAKLASPSIAATVRDFYQAEACLQPGDRVLLAVSGGPDSVTLLHVTCGLAQDLGLGVAVAHFDHRLRPESASDARFVKEMAEKLAVPCFIGAARAGALARRPGAGLEDSARRARYRFLERARVQSGSRFIVTAHNLQDQAETVLLRLIRGAGATGLAAMRPLAGRILRPLLRISRAAILEYCAANHLPFVTDSTNAQPVADRNRLRLNVLPELRGLRPGVDAVLARAAELFAREAEALDWAARMAFDAVRLPSPDDRVTLSRLALAGLPAPVALLALRRAAVAAGREYPPPVDILEQALEFALAPRGGGRLSLAGGVELLRGRATILLRRGGDPIAAILGERELRLPGTVQIPGSCGRLIGRIIADQEQIESLKRSISAQAGRSALFEYAAIAQPLAVRGRRRGDRFVPFGHRRPVSVSEYLTRRGVPPWDRDAVPMVVSPAGVVWLAGLEIDDRYRVQPNTTKVLHLRLEGDR